MVFIERIVTKLNTGIKIMPGKETKKIKGHTRSKSSMDLREGFKVKTPRGVTHVKPYYRKKQKSILK
jgi:hypothetical protein